jgi:hypothetical protein
MPNQPITVRLPSMLLDKLEAYIAESGSSKTDVVVAALAQYLGVSTNVPLVDKLALIERRLAKLEAALYPAK